MADHTPNLPAGAQSAPLAHIPEADVSDELNRAGVAFGDLLERTGQAVAQAQSALDRSSARTASSLARTLVDVIAVEEKIYDDQGNVSDVRVHQRRLPLVSFIDPVFYQWSQVRLQGRFTAREFADARTAYQRGWSRSDKSGQGGLLVILGGGRTTFESQSTTTESELTRSRDLSIGQLRMNAELRPRRDVAIPKPTQVIRGPRLAVIQGEIQDIHDGGVLVERTLSVLLEYTRRDGTPIANKAIAIESEGAAWEHVGGSGVTDAQGRMEILLHRYFLDPEADTSPINVTLSARVGLVQNTTTLTF